VTRLSRALALTCALLLSFTALGAVAQPENTPAQQAIPATGQPACPIIGRADTSADAGTDCDDSDATKKANLAAAREQQRATAATRQQIQAIRAALRARLAALHH
jgi:hypothetical protein